MAEMRAQRKRVRLSNSKSEEKENASTCETTTRQSVDVEGAEVAGEDCAAACAPPMTDEDALHAAAASEDGAIKPTELAQQLLLNSQAPALLQHSVVAAEGVFELLKAYDQISKKYKRSKTRRLQEIEALFEDQKRRHLAHAKATNLCLEMLKKENLWLRHQIEESKIEDPLVRVKHLERKNAECRNDLLMACAKNLELEEEIRSLRSITAQAADTAAEHEGNADERCQSKLLDAEGEIAGDNHQTDAMAIAKTKVSSSPNEASNKGEVPKQAQWSMSVAFLQSITKLQLIADSSMEPSSLTFLHEPTGLKFKLAQSVDKHIAEYCGEGGELRVEMISLGTLNSTVPQWMHDILAFSTKHVHLFFSRMNTAIASISGS